MDIARMVKQAKEMQEHVAKAQEKLEHELVVGTAGGEMVKVTMNARKFITNMELSDDLLKNKDELIDLLVAACRDGAEKADALTEKRLAEATGGFELPKGVSFPV